LLYTPLERIIVVPDRELEFFFRATSPSAR
jgi:hypothetical protein